MIKKELLDILCCPKCKGSVQYDEKKNTLHCSSCNTTYDVKDDIPIMLDSANAK